MFALAAVSVDRYRADVRGPMLTLPFSTTVNYKEAVVLGPALDAGLFFD